MTILNPSFEEPSAVRGIPADWTVADNTAHVEVAEFGDLQGFERFEEGWRLPFGLSLTTGGLVNSTLWASILNGVAVLGDPPDGDHVLHAAVIVTVGVVPGGGVVVAMTYVNENGDPGRQASVVIPESTGEGFEFVLKLEGADVGFTEITALTTSSPLPTTELSIVGSWYLSPRNEASKFLFSDVPGEDTFPSSFDGNPFEGFEAGWTNDGGLRDNFDALNTENAVYDVLQGRAEDFENFEDAWVLPQTPFTPPFNEVVRVALHDFVDGQAPTVAPFEFVVVEDLADRLRLEFLDGGTFTPVEIQIPAASYTPAALAIVIRDLLETALDADSGTADNGAFDLQVLPDGRLRLTNFFDDLGPLLGFMRLLEPSQDSLWGELGFPTGRISQRGADGTASEAATLVPETFESDWRDNQDSTFDLADDANGIIAAADFGGAAPNKPETFESGWLLTLP